MAKVQGLKRALLKQAQTTQVLSIDIEEDIETLDMQNVDGAGSFARTNVLKNVATSADMPAVLLENETMVKGFGEGTEDARNIARYIELIRMKMAPLYAWFDNIAQYRAWNPEFFARMQRLHPEAYRKREYAEVFSEWRASFAAGWPSLLIEPESEQIKVEETKLNGVTDILNAMLPNLDPENKALLMEWAADNIGENKMLFPYALNLDFDALKEFQEEEQERTEEAAEAALKNPLAAPGKPGTKANGANGAKPNGAAKPPQKSPAHASRRA